MKYLSILSAVAVFAAFTPNANALNCTASDGCSESCLNSLDLSNANCVRLSVPGKVKLECKDAKAITKLVQTNKSCGSCTIDCK